MKRPNSDDSALTCVVQQPKEVLVKITHEANQAIINEHGVMLDSINSAQHSSLGETNTINIIQCDQRVIPSNAPCADDKKSCRSKNPPLLEVTIFYGRR